MESSLLGFTPLSLLAGLPGILCVLFVFVSFFLLLEVPSGRYTVLLSSAVAIWSLGYTCTVNAQSPGEALFWARVSTGGLLAFPALCYLFNAAFVKPEGLSFVRKRRLLLLVAAFEILHWTASPFVTEVYRHPWGYFPLYGLPFLAFLAWFVATFWIILRDTWSHYRRTSKGQIRSRDRILFLAWFLCSCGTSDILIGYGVPLFPVSFLPVTLFLLAIFLLLMRHGAVGFLQHWSLESILQSTSDSIFLVNRDGSLSALDSQTATMLGYSGPEELKGRPVNDLFADQAPLYSKHQISRLLRARSSGPLYMELRSRTGDAVPMRMRLSGVFNKKGDLLGLLAIGRDIRHEIEKHEELRRANACLCEKISEEEERTLELARANRELEESRTAIMSILEDMEDSQKKLEEAYQRLAEIDQTKDAFISSVSHELRTPLSSIRSFSELLLHYPDEGEETRNDFLSIIHQESERLTRLVNDILDISKIESGRQQWRDTATDICEVLRSVQQNFSSLAQEKTLEVTVSADNGLPTVYVDRDKIYQVVSNLVSNSVKFTPEGGSIRLGAEVVKNGSPQGAGRPLLRVHVSDTGAGITNKDLHRVFEKFYQGGDTLKDKPRGTGLGLAICREILQHYGGEIWAESNPGEGSCFSFTLPLRHESVRQDDGLPQDPEEPGDSPSRFSRSGPGQDGERIPAELPERMQG